MGSDEILAEAMKAAGETPVKVMKTIMDKIWYTGVWPEDWTLSELTALPKSPGTQDCTKFSTLSLMSRIQSTTGSVKTEVVLLYHP